MRPRTISGYFVTPEILARAGTYPFVPKDLSLKIIEELPEDAMVEVDNKFLPASKVRELYQAGKLDFIISPDDNFVDLYTK